MHTEALDENSRNNLLILKKGNLLNDFYLAGGTAVALHLGHRISYDLDFFSNKSFDGLLLKRIISNLGDYKDSFSNNQNMIGKFNGSLLSFIYYKPEMLGSFQQVDGVNVASIDDLIAMKVEAISQRGRKRDFVDLYFMMKNRNISIFDVMLQYCEKYKDFNLNLVHTLKSFNYFEDAETDQLPEMKVPAKWQDVRNYFESQKYDIVRSLENSGIIKKDFSPDFRPKS